MRPCNRRGLVLVGALLLAATACSAPYDPGPSGELPQAVPDNRLTARFFGVGTVLLSDGRTGVMTDGFFSRPALLQGLAPLRPNEPAIDWALRRGAVEAGTVRAVRDRTAARPGRFRRRTPDVRRRRAPGGANRTQCLTWVKVK